MKKKEYLISTIKFAMTLNDRKFYQELCQILLDTMDMTQEQFNEYERKMLAKEAKESIGAVVMLDTERFYR